MTIYSFGPLDKGTEYKTGVSDIAVHWNDPEGNFASSAFYTVVKRAEGATDDKTYKLTIIFQSDGTGRLEIVETFPVEHSTCV